MVCGLVNCQLIRELLNLTPHLLTYRHLAMTHFYNIYTVYTYAKAPKPSCSLPQSPVVVTLLLSVHSIPNTTHTDRQTDTHARMHTHIYISSITSRISDLFIFSCSSCVVPQAYSASRTLVHFYIILLYSSVPFYIFGGSQKRLFGGGNSIESPLK